MQMSDLVNKYFCLPAIQPTCDSKPSPIYIHDQNILNPIN